MGAGDQKKHFSQNIGELYVVAYLQQLAHEHGLAFASDGTKEHDEFVAYCVERNMLETFLKSPYKRTADIVVIDFFNQLKNKFPGEKFWFELVRHQFRSQNKKGDFVIHLLSGVRKSQSLKNQVMGCESVQLFSGTVMSFFAPILMPTDGVGQVIDPVTGTTFMPSKDRARRNRAYAHLGYAELIPILEKLDAMHEKYKYRYAIDEAALFYLNIKDQLDADRKQFGHEAAGLLIDGLNLIPKDLVKNRLLEMTGLVNDGEDILIMGKGQYISSLFDDKFNTLIHRLNASTSEVSYGKEGQGLSFSFNDENGTIMTIKVPLTLNLNGCWAWIQTPYFEGAKYYDSKKDKGFFAWGERRPNKSKEFATSTNTFLRFSSIGIKAHTPQNTSTTGMKINVNGIDEIMARLQKEVMVKAKEKSHRENRIVRTSHPSGRTKKDVAKEIFLRDYGQLSRQQIVQYFIDEAELTPLGAATYFNNFKKEYEQNNTSDLLAF